jgi:hypothetical protein
MAASIFKKLKISKIEKKKLFFVSGVTKVAVVAARRRPLVDVASFWTTKKKIQTSNRSASREKQKFW